MWMMKTKKRKLLMFFTQQETLRESFFFFFFFKLLAEQSRGERKEKRMSVAQISTAATLSYLGAKEELLLSCFGAC